MTMEQMQMVIGQLITANNTLSEQVQGLLKAQAEAPEVPLNTYNVGF